MDISSCQLDVLDGRIQSREIFDVVVMQVLLYLLLFYGYITILWRTHLVFWKGSYLVVSLKLFIQWKFLLVQLDVLDGRIYFREIFVVVVMQIFLYVLLFYGYITILWRTHLVSWKSSYLVVSLKLFIQWKFLLIQLEFDVVVMQLFLYVPDILWVYHYLWRTHLVSWKSSYAVVSLKLFILWKFLLVQLDVLDGYSPGKYLSYWSCRYCSICCYSMGISLFCGEPTQSLGKVVMQLFL